MRDARYRSLKRVHQTPRTGARYPERSLDGLGRAVDFPVVPIGYRLDKTLGLTLVVWDGTVTGDDAEEHVRRMMFNDPDWPPGPKHLVDLTTATSVPIVANTKLVEMLAEIAEARRIRFALVAGGAFDEGKRFQEAASGIGVTQVIVFNFVTIASTWLGVDPTAAQSALNELRRELRAAN